MRFAAYGTGGATQADHAAAPGERYFSHRKPQDERRGQRGEHAEDDAAGDEDAASFGGQGARDEDSAKSGEKQKRGEVESAVDETTQEDRGFALAGAQSQRTANDVSADDGRQKKRAEEAGEVAANGLEKREAGAGQVDHHAPFGDCHQVCA